MNFNTVKATLPADKNKVEIIHDRQLRNCVTTVTIAIWQSRCVTLKARVYADMRLVN